MKKKTIKATYIGEEKPMGFIKGNDYTLVMEDHHGASTYITTLGAYVYQDVPFPSGLRYPSIFAFLSNWNNIQILEEELA